MTEATPERNLNKITALEGKMSTLEASIKGQMEVQSANIEHMKESAERSEKSVEKLADHCTKLFEKQDEHSRKIVETQGSVRAHEQTCLERDKTIHIQIKSGFDKISEKINSEKANTKEKDDNRKWRIGLYLTIGIAVLGWLVAVL